MKLHVKVLGDWWQEAQLHEASQLWYITPIYLNMETQKPISEDITSYLTYMGSLRNIVNRGHPYPTGRTLHNRVRFLLVVQRVSVDYTST